MSRLTSLDSVVPYETRLDRDSRWAMIEGSRHFEENSAVFEALRKIAKRLQSLEIPYAVVGGMALFRHGFRRFTEYVNVLITRENLRTVHDRLDGLGYLPPHTHSKNLRDTEFGVRIEFLITGEYPGDGKEKPVMFPDPALVSFESDGVRYLNLSTLIELKLASGMTSFGRLKDLSDVLELIKQLNLPVALSEQLNPYVREKYRELWGQGRKRYVAVWRREWLAGEAKSIDDPGESIPKGRETFESMLRDGVVTETEGNSGADRVRLVTTDPEIAKKYEMIEESEYWGEDDRVADEPGHDPKSV